MKERIEINQNGEIHYWTEGDHEDVIVFTHGAAADHDLFKHQVGYFSSQYKVIVWDAPLHGLSRPYKHFSLTNAALELSNILKMEEIEKAHFVGQSMGGYIIQELYKTEPQSVKSLSFIGSNPFGNQYLSSTDRWFIRNSSLFFKVYPYNTLIKEMAKGNSYSRDSFRYMMQTLKKLSKKEIIGILDTIYRDFLTRTEKLAIDCPLLITYGEFDKTGKVPSLCRQWAREQNISAIAIPKASHNANYDNPDAFNELLENFLKQIQVNGQE